MGIGISELLVILVIVILVFGTKRLRGMGGDLGAAIKSFRSAVKEGEEDGKLTAGKSKTGEESAAKDTNKS
jgi:sec-independent protein translocase protein TatA